MFYKIIQNNQIIDVNNEFFRAQYKPHILIKCEPQYCEYVRSSDGIKFYYSDWTATSLYPVSFAEKVDQIVIISEEEYIQLKDQLQDIPITIFVEEEKEEEQEQLETIEEPEIQPEVMSSTELRRKILELEQLVQQLLNK